MSRRAMALLGCATLGCSCVAGNEPIAPQADVERPVSAPEAESAVELTATASREGFAVPSFSTPPKVLLVTIARIHNPLAQSFMVTVELVGADQAGVVALGTFTPYPPDQGGTFILPVPVAAERRLVSPTTPLVLRLTLSAVRRERPLVEPLTVVVAQPQWRSTAP